MSSLNIHFPKNDLLAESLKNLGNDILWRKSERGASDHFKLKIRNSKKEGNTSLFKLISDQSLEDNGKNFLIFFFLHPAKSAFCRNPQDLRESIAVSFYPKQLLTLISSLEGGDLRDKLEKLELSDRQCYGEHATHYGLYYQKKLDGEYFDLDDKVLLALNNCSEINPKEQETDDENKYAFINAIIDICKKSIEQQP